MTPPGLRRWHVIAAVTASGLIGAAIGLAGFTFVYARGASYLTNDPRACANDCHAPPGGLAKYMTKARNGFHAPGEAARILAISIDLARQGQLALRDGAPSPAPAP